MGGRYLSPGLGFGGGCRPKDIRALRAAAADKGVASLAELLATVDGINLGRRDRVTALARQAVGGALEGKRIAALGIAFKPNSDDIRDSPSLGISARLAAQVAVVSVPDPPALPNAARHRPELGYAASVSGAVSEADLVLHLTEWADYRAIDPPALAQVVTTPPPIAAPCTLAATL